MKRTSHPKTNTNKRPQTSAVASPMPEVQSSLIARPPVVTAEVCGRLLSRRIPLPLTSTEIRTLLPGYGPQLAALLRKVPTSIRGAGVGGVSSKA